MATNKFKSPHDRALIAFGSDVLAILEDNHEWNSDTLDQIQDSARNFGLATTTSVSEFMPIPRERFRNRLGV